MGFLEDVSEDQSRSNSKKCSLVKALEQMDDDLNEEVVEAVNNSSLTAASISRVLEKRGYQVGPWALRQCRRTCKCGVVKR